MGGCEVPIPVGMEPTSGIPPCFDFYSNPGPLVGFYDNRVYSFEYTSVEFIVFKCSISF